MKVATASSWIEAVALLLVAFALPAQAAPAKDAAKEAAKDVARDIRAEEIASCRADEIKTWNDGRDAPAASRQLVFAYEPGGAPAWLPRREVYAAIEQALQAWGACGLQLELLPLGQVAPAGAIRIRWDAAGSRGNAGLADVGQRTLSLGPQVFALLRQRNPAWPVMDTLQMTLSHEIGHFLGLGAHSRRCVDVMSYYSDAKGARCELREPSAFRSRVEYRASLPTACDIARCRAVNGVAAR
ncbi:hypothetical protein ACFJGW_03975 [Burkholderiaceae bacterium UC74_6]